MTRKYTRKDIHGEEVPESGTDSVIGQTEIMAMPSDKMDEVARLRAEIAELKMNNGIVPASPRDLTPTKNTRVATDDLQTRRARNNRLVKGKFRDLEIPGGTIQFSAGPFEKGDITQTYTMTCGQVYEIPLAVANHLNNDCYVPEYSHKPGELFKPAINPDVMSTFAVEKKVHRFAFQPLDLSFDIESRAIPSTKQAALGNSH